MNPLAPSGAPALGIVADDLTGASDSAVQFTRSGWQARLALTWPPPDSAAPGTVTAVVTDARSQSSAAARSATRSGVTALRAAGITRLFLKLDSTLRGTAIHQVEGALDAWGVEHPDAVAIVCTAYPAMGRTVAGGRLLVHGEPAHTTAAGRDPRAPLTTADLAELVPGSAHVRLDSASASDAAAQLSAALDGRTRILTVDASSDDDLRRLAEAIVLLGTRAVPAGAAGLASAMAQAWTTPPANVVGDTAHRAKAARRIVIVVSSLHDVSRKQMRTLLRSVPPEEVRLLEPPLPVALNPDDVPEWMARELSDARELPSIVVVSSPSELPRQPQPADARRHSAAEAVTDCLAAITEAIVRRVPVDAIMLIGGDGARVILQRLGAEVLLLHRTMREGVPIGTLEGGKASGITTVTKAGGFGTPETVFAIARELLTTEGSAS